jgi:probable rRNA maturation factor
VSGVLTIRNQQRLYQVNLRLLRRMTRTLLVEFLQCEEFDLGVYLVSGSQSAGLNERYLGHQGPTDVITFNYGDSLCPEKLVGEVFVCPEVAVDQARRFRTSWQSEVARYVVHGTLHLQGFDDHEAGERRRMKRVENRLVSQLKLRYGFAGLGSAQAGGSRAGAGTRNSASSAAPQHG